MLTSNRLFRAGRRLRKVRNQEPFCPARPIGRRSRWPVPPQSVRMRTRLARRRMRFRQSAYPLAWRTTCRIPSPSVTRRQAPIHTGAWPPAWQIVTRFASCSPARRRMPAPRFVQRIAFPLSLPGGRCPAPREPAGKSAAFSHRRRPVPFPRPEAAIPPSPPAAGIPPSRRAGSAHTPRTPVLRNRPDPRLAPYPRAS